MIVLPYLGKLSLQIPTKINCVMTNKLPYCNFKILFQTKSKLTDFFTFRDEIIVFLRAGIVHKFDCGGCNATHYGKTMRHFKFRMFEHLGVSALTRKRVKTQRTVIVSNKSWRRLKDVFSVTICHLLRHLRKTSLKCLEHVFIKTNVYWEGITILP